MLKSPIPAHLTPRHVAIIMDGNGRWAKVRGRPRIWGHKRGVESVRQAVEAAGEWGIKVLTLFAFSEENWGRPRTEVSGIFNLLDVYLRKERDELNHKNVVFRTMGDLSRLPLNSQKIISETREFLAGNTGLILNVALSYGGRHEILNTCRLLAQKVKEGTLDPDEISQELFTKNLDTAELPEPDLLIRTSGEQRISNFLLWQSAYTEFYFSNIHWPEFGKKEFADALIEYSHRQRRFGLTTASSLVPFTSSPLPPNGGRAVLS